MRWLWIAAASLAATGCASVRKDLLWGPQMPAAAGWAAHAAVTAGAAAATHYAFGDARWGALSGCVFYVAKEWEETQGWTYFQFGKRDAAMDVLTPCAVSVVVWRLR